MVLYDPNKEQVIILERFEIVFSTFKKPEIFQTDNGTEFKNFKSETIVKITEQNLCLLDVPKAPKKC